MSKLFKLFLLIVVFMLCWVLFARYYLSYFVVDETCISAKCAPAHICFAECKKEGFIKYPSCVKYNNCEEL